MGPLLYVYGPSNSGKTMIVERLLKAPELADLRIATIKRSTQSTLDFDVEGKDTWRHQDAGAVATGATSSSNSMLIVPRNVGIHRILVAIEALEGADLVLVEGLGDDAPGSAAKVAVGSVEEKAPGTVVELTGGEADLGQVLHAIERIRGKAEDAEGGVRLRVDGRDVPIKGFVQDFLEGTVRGAISTLRKTGEGDEEVEIRLPKRRP
jgi:molybdopterin-guanine dinucleotide biosynthesis protein B